MGYILLDLVGDPAASYEINFLHHASGGREGRSKKVVGNHSGAHVRLTLLFSDQARGFSRIPVLNQFWREISRLGKNAVSGKGF